LYEVDVYHITDVIVTDFLLHFVLYYHSYT